MTILKQRRAGPHTSHYGDSKAFLSQTLVLLLSLSRFFPSLETESQCHTSSQVPCCLQSALASLFYSLISNLHFYKSRVKYSTEILRHYDPNLIQLDYKFSFWVLATKAKRKQLGYKVSGHLQRKGDLQRTAQHCKTVKYL